MEHGTEHNFFKKLFLISKLLSIDFISWLFESISIDNFSIPDLVIEFPSQILKIIKTYFLKKFS